MNEKQFEALKELIMQESAEIRADIYELKQMIDKEVKKMNDRNKNKSGCRMQITVDKATVDNARAFFECDRDIVFEEEVLEE